MKETFPTSGKYENTRTRVRPLGKTLESEENLPP